MLIDSSTIHLACHLNNGDDSRATTTYQARPYADILHHLLLAASSTADSAHVVSSRRRCMLEISKREEKSRRRTGCRCVINSPWLPKHSPPHLRLHPPLILHVSCSMSHRPTVSSASPSTESQSTRAGCDETKKHTDVLETPSTPQERSPSLLRSS